MFDHGSSASRVIVDIALPAPRRAPEIGGTSAGAARRYLPHRRRGRAGGPGRIPDLLDLDPGNVYALLALVAAGSGAAAVGFGIIAVYLAIACMLLAALRPPGRPGGRAGWLVALAGAVLALVFRELEVLVPGVQAVSSPRLVNPVALVLWLVVSTAVVLAGCWTATPPLWRVGLGFASSPWPSLPGRAPAPLAAGRLGVRRSAAARRGAGGRAQVLDELVALWRVAGMDVVTTVEPNLLVAGRSSVLAQVVTNLLTNCARHAAGAQVQVIAGRAGDNERIVVRDDGPGLDPAVMRRGIGLTLSERLAESEGGS